MSFELTDNTPKIKADMEQKSSIFLRLAADQLITISTPNTPKDKGNLRQDIGKQVLGLHGKVIWGKNYAQYQEGKQFKNYTTPGTGPNFAKNAAKELPNNTSKLAKSAQLI